MPHPSTEGGEILDVLIVGAGLSGIGAAWHLQKHCPDKRYAILEARDAIAKVLDNTSLDQMRARGVAGAPLIGD